MPVDAEVVGFEDDRLYLMPLAEVAGLRPGALVVPIEDPSRRRGCSRPDIPRRRAEDRSRWLPNGEALLGGSSTRSDGPSTGSVRSITASAPR